MSKIFKVGKIILIGAITIFIVTNLLWELLSLVTTKNSNKLYSPDRRYYAQFQETIGGATTSYMTDLMIADAKSMIINFGFFYTGNENNMKWIFGFDGALDSVKFQWLDSHTLKVNYSDCKKVYNRNKSWKNIKIVYEGKCSENN